MKLKFRHFILGVIILITALAAISYYYTKVGELDAVKWYRVYKGMELFDDPNQSHLALDLSNKREQMVIKDIENEDETIITNLILPYAPGILKQENSHAAIDYSNYNLGYIMIRWKGLHSNKLKVLITYPSGIIYNYNLTADGTYDTFPLTGGIGDYIIGVYKNVDGTTYKNMLSYQVTMTSNTNYQFVRPNKMVNYGPKSKAVKKAVTLCSGLHTESEKIAAIYNYIISNITYDGDKAIESDYLNMDIDKTFSSKKGICYDYAGLLAVMLRSQGIMTKFIIGTTGDAYHSWVLVYAREDGKIDDKTYLKAGEWKLLDPTFIASNKSKRNNKDSGDGNSVIKYVNDDSHYKAKYVY